MAQWVQPAAGRVGTAAGYGGGTGAVYAAGAGGTGAVYAAGTGAVLGARAGTYGTAPVAGYGTAPVAQSAAAAGMKTAVTRQAHGHSEVALKNMPDGSGTVIGTVPNGQPVQILQESGEYCLVGWQGKQGYAKTSNLAVTAAAAGPVAGGVITPARLSRVSSPGGTQQLSTEWEWRGQRYKDLASLEKAVQESAAPSTMQGLGLKVMLAPEHKEKLEYKIKELFHQYAGADRRLQYHEMRNLAAVLAAMLRIPQSSFGNLDLMFYRYDFSGTGELDEGEGIMLIEGMLRAYRDSQETASGTGPLAVATGSAIPTKELEGCYTLSRELGKGGQGEVWLATDNSNGQEKVVKFYSKGSANMPLDDIIDEFALLTRLDHPKIARTYEIFQDTKNIYAVSEPYFGGDLTKVTEQATANGVALTAQWYTAIWAQVCQGLKHLHSKHVMHCDLKEPNVMISGTANWSAPNVVLIDFGCAKNFRAEARGGGTPGYMPPEVWQSNLWTTKGDTFSLGVMIYRMFTQRVPFGETAGADLARWRDETIRCTLPPPPVQLQQYPQLNTLLIRMLHREFRSRPTMEAILQDPWFQGQNVDDGGAKHAARKLTLVDDKKDLHVALLADYASRENLSQLEDVSKLFASLDVDQDGTVTADEARSGLAGKMPPEQIEALIKAMMGENGEIAYTKFMGHMIAQKQQSVTKMLYALFKDLDKDGSGYLDLAEIQQMLERPQVSEVMAGKTAQQLMAEIDTNNTGRISWPEFQKYLDKRFNGEIAVNGWRPGHDAEYLSGTHNTWVACKITGVHPQSQSIMLSCKPGAWIDPASQSSKVRRPGRT